MSLMQTALGAFPPGSTVTAPMLADACAASLSYRVQAYRRDLREFQRLLAYCAAPSFNADREPVVWLRHEKLREALKAEADALWHRGINVYGN